MKKLLFIIALLLGTFTFTSAQNEKKFSPGTRMTIAVRDGKMTTQKVAKQQLLKKNNLTTQAFNAFDTTNTCSEEEEDVTFAEPFISEGVEKVAVWVRLTDNNTTALERIPGLKVTATFDKLVTANVPLKALEEVAALKNVKKVSVATMLKNETYYGREATNVDDVLNWTADAQEAGLLQAYDGTGVVIGIVDTGIQFDHKMFKDENGNTRIKKAFVYDANQGELLEYSTPSAIEALTYDYNGSYHGSHTSSIAGGSNFTYTGYYYDNVRGSVVNGTRVYGGMAPKADLVLCGLANETSETNIAACIQKISEYADQVGKPCVISISLGSQLGPHDGTGYMTDVAQQCMNKPGRIIVKSSGNDAERNIYHYKNNASKASPAMSLLDLTIYDGVTNYNNYYLYGQALIYARTPGVELAARFYVVDITNNTVVWVSDEMTGDTKWSVNSNDPDAAATYNAGLAQYFSAMSQGDDAGHLIAWFDTEETGKKSIHTVVSFLETKGYTSSGLTTRTGKYKIGISCYPKNSGETTDIDSWGLSSTYFSGATATYNGTSYTFVAGNNLCSLSDNATSPYVISVGNYNTMLRYSNAGNSSNTSYSTVTGDIGDIHTQSSFQAPGCGPLGTKLPWITAPGRMIVAAGNKGWVSNGNTNSSRLVRNYDANNPLVITSGTSMAAPCAGGIVALWLQVDPTLTLQQVKDLMVETAITDNYTSGTYASRFGNGKIDALKGIQYLINNNPIISATPTNVTFDEQVFGTFTKTITIKGRNLTSNITATLNDPNGVYSITPTNITKEEAESAEGVTITITYTPNAEGTTTASITLASEGAANVTVNINGKVEEKKEYVYVLTSTLKAGEEYLIVSRNTAGAGYALGHSGTSVASDAVTVKNDDVYGTDANDLYIEESDVDATSKWTASSGWTFKNGSYYVATTSSFLSRSLAISTSSTNWTWSGGNNRLYYDGVIDYYLRYNNGFGLTTSASSIYLYQKVEKKKEPAKIFADEQELNFEVEINDSQELTFNVSAENLRGNVTVTLNDENGVFSVSPTTISKANAEAGKPVTVTFSPQVFGEYEATITFSSPYAESVVVNLKAIANQYFNVLISPAGLTTLYLDYPVEIPFSKYDGLIGVYYIWDIGDGTPGTVLKAAPLTRSIPEYTGVIVQGNPNDAEIPFYRFKRIKDNVESLGDKESKLDGLLIDTPVADVIAQTSGVVYTLGRSKNAVINFFRFTGTTLSANKAFLLISQNANNANALSFTIDFDGEATGIKNIDITNEDGAWYTIEGIKQQGTPTRKGMYIHNGKTVVVK